MDIAGENAPRIIFGTFDPAKIATMSHSSVVQLDNDSINMSSYADNSKQMSAKEGWTLITHKRNWKKCSKASKKTLLIRAKIYRQDPRRVNSKKSSPIMLWDFFLEYFQKLASFSRSYHHIDRNKEQLNVKVDITRSSMVMFVDKMKENYSSAIRFSDTDLLFGHKSHNRPLFVSGYTCGTKINTFFRSRFCLQYYTIKGTKRYRIGSR